MNVGINVWPISVNHSIPFHPSSNHKYELQLTIININPTSITSLTLLLGTNTMVVDSITPTTALSAITTSGATMSSSSSVGMNVGLGGILGVGIVSTVILI